MGFAVRKSEHVALAVCAAGVVALTAGCTGSSSGGTEPSTDSGQAVTGSPSVAASPPAPRSSASTATGPAHPSSGRVKAPSPGNIHQTVPSRTVRTIAPVAPSATAKFGNKVTVRATKLAAINATAHGPGEIGGPAVEITLAFVNGSARRINLSNSVVTVSGSSGAQGLPISGAPAKPVTGALTPGKSAVGRYVFTLAKSERAPITINVSYSPSAPVVLIVGRVG